MRISFLEKRRWNNLVKVIPIFPLTRWANTNFLDHLWKYRTNADQPEHFHSQRVLYGYCNCKCGRVFMAAKPASRNGVYTCSYTNGHAASARDFAVTDFMIPGNSLSPG